MKKLFAVLAVVALMATLFAVTAFAAPGRMGGAGGMGGRGFKGTTSTRIQLTDAQRQALQDLADERYELCQDMFDAFAGLTWTEAADKWAVMSATEKDDFYAICENVHDIEKEALDLYVSYGMITKEQAQAQKDRLDENLTYMIDNDLMPMGGGMRGGCSNGGGLRGGCGNNVSGTCPNPAAGAGYPAGGGIGGGRFDGSCLALSV